MVRKKNDRPAWQILGCWILDHVSCGRDCAEKGIAPHRTASQSQKTGQQQARTPVAALLPAHDRGASRYGKTKFTYVVFSPRTLDADNSGRFS